MSLAGFGEGYDKLPNFPSGHSEAGPVPSVEAPAPPAQP